MKNGIIFKRAVKKALKNGWMKEDDNMKIVVNEWGVTLIIKESGTIFGDFSVYDVIFFHGFAKAFWHCNHKVKDYVPGSYKEECELCGETTLIGMNFDNWEYHLQEMVILENPLKYLEKYL